MGESSRKREYERLHPRQRLGDGPIQAEYHEKMVAVMQAIDKFFNGDAKHPNKKIGIVMMVYPFGEIEGRTNYMSNGADRKDVVTLMKEMIARFEGQPKITGSA